MRRKGFTLVELLVVIGIIAVLIGVLLPALNGARKQANAVKCAAALREIGQCFNFYQMENRGYFPPTKTASSVYRISFNTPIAGSYDSTIVQYWYTFLIKYVTKNDRIGANATTGNDRAAARNNLMWGCPSWEGLFDGAYNGNVNYADTGYGMNAFPEYTSSYPTPADPPNTIGDTIDVQNIAVCGWQAPSKGWDNINVGKWYKAKAWTRPAERALVGDTRLWLLEAQACPMNGQIPPQMVATDYTAWTTNGQTLFDFYRHGTAPPSGANRNYAPTGGKVAFNVLFCDGHVTTLNDRAEGYKVTRMRFPG